MMRRSIPAIKSLATRDEPSVSAANFAKLVLGVAECHPTCTPRGKGLSVTGGGLKREQKAPAVTISRDAKRYSGTPALAPAHGSPARKRTEDRGQAKDNARGRR